MHAAAAAQSPGSRVAEGRVRVPGARAPRPVPGLWVVLHRVGSDRAAPLDSVRSDAEGRFRFRYTPSGDAEALYFVSAQYRGVAYFSPPLRAAAVRGGEADLMVYDTTSSGATLRVQGRHLVVSAPRAGATREIAEVFEIENEGSRTVVPRDSTNPLWSARFPADAESLSVAPGDLTGGAVSFRGGRGEVFAPIAPGLRQLVVTYRLRPRAFPLTLTLDLHVAVLEVLLEEPRAAVEGPGLTETEAARIEGRVFRRFLARDVPASTMLRVRTPAPVRRNQTAIGTLALALLAAMAASLLAWRTRGPRPPAPVPSTPSDGLIAELAELDARFERQADPTEAQRAEYARARAALKQRVARALESERRAT